MVRGMKRGRFFLNEVHMHHVDCNVKRITGLVMSLRSIASQFLRQRILPLRRHYRLRQNSCQTFPHPISTVGALL
jgi:hypothetical protein